MLNTVRNSNKGFDIL